MIDLILEYIAIFLATVVVMLALCWFHVFMIVPAARFWALINMLSWKLICGFMQYRLNRAIKRVEKLKKRLQNAK